MISQIILLYIASRNLELTILEHFFFTQKVHVNKNKFMFVKIKMLNTYIHIFLP